MKTDYKKAKNLSTPGKPMSSEDFINIIKEGEEGEFLNEADFHKRFEEWRLKRKK